MGQTLLSIIGSLIVFLLGVIMYMIKATRADLERLERKFETDLKEAKSEIFKRVERPECLREMADIRTDLRDAIKDIRTLERNKP
jgi:hypothetical protein